ncbi:MMPL family transporter [Paractinoplanes rishiriensis]|uniref:Membrane protein n=1 Tax=Paractinoplanes rishiriensis TaxID=1050105 RepID=A0A919JTN6_9ACTN|nr:MMPL family transporter [Actinoplanes rishiriensis]GIE94605.1 membrane protein [Actinoplanes rishiriensis]
MATLLYRLGRFSFRRRRLVALLWVAVLAVLGVGAGTLSGPTSDAFTIPGTESTRALDVLRDKMGMGADNAQATVVFAVDGGSTLTGPAQHAAISGAVAALARAPHVASVTDPFQTKAISQDLRTGYATVTYTIGQPEVTEADRAALTAAGRTATGAGIRVEFGGTALSSEGEPDTTTEALGVAISAVVLVITFGALIAAGLPLLTALLGVAAGMAGIQIATGFFDLSSSTSALATMLGLAVGIDYALFVVSRFRHELAEGHEGEEAAGRATGTAGSAVIFAGLTVIIALAALAVTGIPFLAAMGFAAAGTVAVAVLITLTLTPALLGFAGHRVIAKKHHNRPATAPTGKKLPFGQRWAIAVLRNRVAALVLALGVLGALAVPALDLRLALPDDSTAAPDTTQRQAYDRLSEGFGAGFNGPLIIVIEAAAGSAQAAGEQAREALTKLEDVVFVTPAAANPAGDTAMLTVIPGSAPNSDATKDLVAAIRDLHPATGARLSVTGTTALNLDVTDKITTSLIPYLAIVVGLALILLMLVFRSIVVPIKATLGFLLSVAATFGAVVAVFQWGWLADVFGVSATGPIMSLMPIFLIGILFGLAMDYEVFLVTRTREEFVHGATPDQAVVSGMKHGARVVTAAALIMISVFAGFIFADDSIIKTLGFALAFGVAVDAFLVRMTIVPAVLSLVGRAAWWLPGWLDRALPNVDVEGNGLAAGLAATETPAPPPADEEEELARAA